MKVVGIERLRLAGERRGPEGSSSLLGGATEVWGAMFEMPSWPIELQVKAVELQTSLFRYGPIRATVEQSAEPERRQLHQKLLEFIGFAERIGASEESAVEEAI